MTDVEETKECPFCGERVTPQEYGDAAAAYIVVAASASDAGNPRFMDTWENPWCKKHKLWPTYLAC